MTLRRTPRVILDGPMHLVGRADKTVCGLELKGVNATDLAQLVTHEECVAALAVTLRAKAKEYARTGREPQWQPDNDADKLPEDERRMSGG